MLEGDPAAVAGDRLGHVPPQGRHLLVQPFGGGHLGGNRFGDIVHPAFEQGEQQALLPAEVVIHGARCATGRLGDGVDRRPVDTSGGEQLGGGVEERPAGLRSTFHLGDHSVILDPLCKLVKPGGHGRRPSAAVEFPRSSAGFPAAVVRFHPLR